MAARLRRRQALWRKFRRRAVVGSVMDPSGPPSSSLPEAARLPREHWSEVFKAPSLDQELWDEVKPFIQTLDGPLNSAWKLDYYDWRQMLIKRNNSMSGPDGIPYS
eukprot:7236312-Pyramimonas_sp.AAC.1